MIKLYQGDRGLMDKILYLQPVLQLTVLLLTFSLLLFFFSVKGSEPTHSVLVEVFTSETCPHCMNSCDPAIQELWQENDYHDWHLVIYRVSTSEEIKDSLETEYGLNKAKAIGGYSDVSAPIVLFDGGYERKDGSSENIKDEYQYLLWKSMQREVPQVRLRLDTDINGEMVDVTLYVDLDQSDAIYNLVAVVYIVEDNVEDYVYVLKQVKTFNSIFRGLALEECVPVLTGNGVILHGSWRISSDSNPSNLRAIAAVYDENGYAIQSTCSYCGEAGVKAVYRFLKFHREASISTTEIEEKLANTLQSKFNLKGRIYVGTYPGVHDLVAIGGPLSNSASQQFIEKTLVVFNKLDNRIELRIYGSVYVNRSGTWVEVENKTFIFNSSNWASGDYGVATIAYDKWGRRSILMLMGCTRYGTEAITKFLIEYWNNFQTENIIVVRWFDRDGNKRVSIDEVELVAYG